MNARQELIDDVRRCAEAGLSAGQAAAELGITRNAIIGQALRNGIKFHGQPGQGRPRKPKPASVLARKPKLISIPVPHVVSPKSDWKSKPSFRCAWAGCTCEVTPGQMLCLPHSKKPLFGPAVSCA